MLNMRWYHITSLVLKKTAPVTKISANISIKSLGVCGVKNGKNKNLESWFHLIEFNAWHETIYLFPDQIFKKTQLHLS